MSIKVAAIGAGAVGFTRGICRDILTVPELQDTRFAFMDLSEHNLDMTAQLMRKGIKAESDKAKERPAASA